MNYKYYITAIGNSNEQQITDVLNNIGLKVDEVEAYPDVESIINELDEKPDSTLNEKWNELCKLKEFQQKNFCCLVSNAIEGKVISIKDLAQLMKKCGIEADLPDEIIAKLIIETKEKLK